MTSLTEGADYIIDQNGNWIFTRRFHIERGRCCHNDCLQCPYRARELKGFQDLSQTLDQCPYCPSARQPIFEVDRFYCLDCKRYSKIFHVPIDLSTSALRDKEASS